MGSAMVLEAISGRALGSPRHVTAAEQRRPSEMVVPNWARTHLGLPSARITAEVWQRGRFLPSFLLVRSLPQAVDFSGKGRFVFAFARSKLDF
jgi:hypothetical protein